MKTVKILCVMIVAAVLGATGAQQPAGAQETGSIVGTVTSSEDSTSLAYANVVVMGTTLGSMTRQDGSYEVTGVTPGTYRVRAMMMGFAAVEKKDIVVRAGEKTSVDFRLTPTIVLETQKIIVEAERKMVEVTTSDASTSVSTEALQEMPIDNLLDAIPLKGGGVKRGDRMHVRGGRGSEIGVKDGVRRPARPGDIGIGSSQSAIRLPREAYTTENYDFIRENDFHDAMDKPFSTFAVDVDAASYSNLRRFLKSGQTPPVDAVRVEEMVNYFKYDYPQPEGSDPFSINAQVADCPWNKAHRLVHVGLRGRDIDLTEAPPSNLVFLIDVSGSMKPANKLPLLKEAFLELTDHMREQDRVAIVVYASYAGVLMHSISGDQKNTIRSCIARLQAGGSTAGGAGIKRAYEMAEANFVEGGNNRVILATDGDFNTGPSSDSEMVRLIEDKRKSGVFLTVLGFGEANLKDAKLEQIADHGNGHYAYIDDIFEAKKVLVNEMAATLYVIAKDVKIQVEFNPAKVAQYRLIGYENRLLNRRDFDDDKKDAGEIGAGHSVTALYEVIPVDDDLKADAGRQSKYTVVSLDPNAFATSEMLTVRIRYKEPDGEESLLIEQPVADDGANFDQASDDFRWAAAVAEFGMLIRNSAFVGDSSHAQVLEIARSSTGEDKGGYRHEFVRMVEMYREIVKQY